MAVDKYAASGFNTGGSQLKGRGGRAELEMVRVNEIGSGERDFHGWRDGPAHVRVEFRIAGRGWIWQGADAAQIEVY